MLILIKVSKFLLAFFCSYFFVIIHIISYMELTFLELAKREVISVTDGKSLGYVKDLGLTFPSGVMTGIFVPGKKLKWFQKCFNKTLIFIERKNIVKIGGDVILVDLYKKEEKRPPKPQPTCPPSCPPPCPPPCHAPNKDEDFRIDLSDY